MKILAVSDQVIDRLYSDRVKNNYPDINMIIGCGDLPYSYLEFLVTVFNLPMYYVPGNHDPEFGPSPDSRAEGGTNLDGRVIFTKGLLIAGLGGSILYQPGGLDLLITHSPPEGIHDDDDPTHHGLRAINLILRWAQPRYMFHGHTIFYHQNLGSHITTYRRTQVVNIYPFRVMDID
jgi:Icc-related predicted phosphoesterase